VKDRIRLLIADDHPVVRDGLKGMLAAEADLEVVGEAADGRELLKLAETLRPDAVLVDLRMPVVDGVTAIGRLRERWPQVGILVLTTYDTDSDIQRAVEAGATGYVLKDAPREELLRAIRATARGQSFLSPSVAARLMGRLRGAAGETLTVREAEVLELVAKGRGNREIARSLRLSEATVKTHLIHIYAKLGAADRAHAVTLAIQKGIIGPES
jgi:DNA-binding NarL/FixJ family response regulator